MKDGMKMLQFLEQDALENNGNKLNIKEKVDKDLLTGLDDQINRMVEAVQDYTNQEYWDSKNSRIIQLMGYPSCRQLVLDILTITARITHKLNNSTILAIPVILVGIVLYSLDHPVNLVD